MKSRIILLSFIAFLKIAINAQETISIKELNEIKLIDKHYKLEFDISETDDKYFQIIDDETTKLIILKENHLKFTESGGIHIPEEIVLEINSHINAKVFQIFYDDGNVDFINSKTNLAFPEWWGANAYDATDDYKAIKKAVNSHINIVKFSLGEYLISDEISIYNQGITLLGEEVFANALTTLKFTSEKINSTLFHFKYPKDCNIINLKLTSNYLENKDSNKYIKEKQQTCIKFHCNQKEALTDSYWANLDGIVKKCVFSGFDKTLVLNGRNMIIKDNLFNAYGTAIDIKYDKNFYDPENVFEASHLLGFRGYNIFNNRFHSGLDTSILVEGYNSENLYGCKITDNIHDTYCTFFKGSLSESIISDNIIHRVYLNPVIQLNNSNHLTINDNFIGGEKNNHEQKRNPKFPIWAKHGIVFQNRAFNITITGNHLNNIKRDAILFKNLCSNTIISKNIISNFGLGIDKLKEGEDPNNTIMYHNIVNNNDDRNIDASAAIMLNHSNFNEKNPFMNQFINNNIVLRNDKKVYGIWITKKLDKSTITPNIFNVNQSTSDNLYLYNYD